MQKYLIAFAMLLAVGAGCTANINLGDDVAADGDDVAICENTCGNGTCEEIVCQGSGCPCAETADSCPQDCSADSDVIAQKDDLIFVTSAGLNGATGNPASMIVTGEARGNWYFEASFPVKVYDSNNVLVGSGIATAEGEWMTEEYVPFKAIVPITSTAPLTDTGTVVLEKDNPSGLPENDNSLTVPVNLVQ
jgi:hypothetical protein